MGRLIGFLRGHKKESFLSPLFKMLEALFDLLVPLIMADIINVGIAGGDRGYILQRCLLMVLLGMIGLVCSITAQYFAAKASVESCGAIRHSLFETIQSLEASQRDLLGANTLITRMTSDVNQVQNGLNLFLRLFLRSPFVVFGAMILAFTISIKGAVLFAVTIPALAAVVFAIMLRTIPRYEQVQRKMDDLTGVTRENLTGARVVRAFNRQQDETRRFEETNGQLTRSQLRVGRISALMNPLTYAMINLAIVALLQTGALQVDTGELAMGDVVALVNYMNQILLELVKLANLIIQMTKATACADRIRSILALHPEMTFGQDMVDASASDIAVEFDHVSLTYTDAGGESLKDISFIARRGETIGVIGGTGSGKTSLARLIPRYYDATRGHVRLFGKDIRAYDKISLRRSVGTVLQKATLFAGSIRSNLLWGRADADEESLWQALSAAQADEIVRSKSGGLDEPVEQGGRNLSGGQKQRLSIARSLAARPDILILDDSSSALDYATDARLRKALHTLPSGMTTFIISQRTNSISHADRILVLDEGRLAGAGRHEELLKSCPVYREIYDSQFKKAEA